MRISEAATRSGLSADTIRYYEKSGMLPDIPRAPSGVRVFDQRIVDWLTLLYWLRETGMPMARMRRFTTLARAGGDTVAERREILIAHSEDLARRRALLDKCEAVLAIKIASYGGHRGDPTP